LHWLLGLLFAGVGSLFALGPLGLFRDAPTLRWPVGILCTALGAVVVAAGLWVLSRAPRSRLTVDATADRVQLRRWGLAGRFAVEWPLAEVAAVRLVESRDDEGGAVFQVHLVMREGASVPVSPVWYHGRRTHDAIARRLAAALRVPATAPGADTAPAPDGD
jgi:hypothetical protein